MNSICFPRTIKQRYISQKRLNQTKRFTSHWNPRYLHALASSTCNWSWRSQARVPVALAVDKVEVAKREAAKMPAVGWVAPGNVIRVMGRNQVHRSAAFGYPVDLADSLHHIPKMLDDVDRPDLVEGVVRERKGAVKVSDNVSAVASKFESTPIAPGALTRPQPSSRTRLDLPLDIIGFCCSGKLARAGTKPRQDQTIPRSRTNHILPGADSQQESARAAEAANGRHGCVPREDDRWIGPIAPSAREWLRLYPLE